MEGLAGALVNCYAHAIWLPYADAVPPARLTSPHLKIEVPFNDVLVTTPPQGASVTKPSTLLLSLSMQLLGLPRGATVNVYLPRTRLNKQHQDVVRRATAASPSRDDTLVGKDFMTGIAAAAAAIMAAFQTFADRDDWKACTALSTRWLQTSSTPSPTYLSDKRTPTLLSSVSLLRRRISTSTS